MNRPPEHQHSDVRQAAKIYLLGRFEIQLGGRTLTADDWPRKKAASLMKRLAYERRTLKDQALEFLWPEAGSEAGANNLYKNIHIVRQTLEKILGRGSSEALLRFEGGIISLLPTVWVDTEEFTRLLAASSDQSPRANLEKALDIYQGDLLPDDLYEEWTLQPREALFRQQREARLTLSAIYREEREYGTAIHILDQLLIRDPADEVAHRELMRLYALAGRQQDAQRQYQRCVETLASDLGVLPAEETTVLHQQIINGELVSKFVPEISLKPQDNPMNIAGSVIAAEKPRPLFVARARELEILQAHLASAVGGEGQVVFITGEAGQGKTSLMAEFAYRALIRHQDLIVAAGACQALSGIADPYLPFRDMVAALAGDWQRPWLGNSIPASLARRLQALAHQTVEVIARLSPGLIGSLVPGSIVLQASARGQHTLSQNQIFAQMGDLLRELAHRQPLLLLLDDLQWIDFASAGLFFYLARQLVNSPIMIVGAFRPSEVSQPGSAHPLAPVIQELVRTRGEIQIDLDALQTEEERGFVDALLNSEPNQLDASFREALFRHTRGHPLFSVELLRALQEQGDLVQDEAGLWIAQPTIGWDVLPSRVEAVIARRIDRLPAQLRRLLEIASIEGDSFTVEVLANVQQASIAPLLNDLSGELDQRYRLIREQGEFRLGNRTLTRYQFRHHLFQAYLYQHLSQAQRRLLHGQVGLALEQFCDGNCQPILVPLAYHFLSAGDFTRAVPYLIQAGDDSRQRFALDEAAHFYQTALDHWQGDELRQASTLQKLGEVLLTMGKASIAVDRFLNAERLYAGAGSRAGQGAVQRLIGRSYWELGDRTRALASYHSALEILRHEPEGEELARAYSGISQMHMLADEYQAALDWGRRAVKLARKLAAEDVIAHAQVHMGISKIATGDVDTGLDMLTSSLEQARLLGLPHDIFRAHTGLGDSLIQLERYNAAREVYEQMRSDAVKIGAAMFEGVALVQLGYLDWWAGRWRLALERLEHIRAWMEADTSSVISKIWASTLMAQVWNDLGIQDQARAALSDYTGAARSAGEQQTIIPHLLQLARAAESKDEQTHFVQEMVDILRTAAFPRYETLPALALVGKWMVDQSGGDYTALQLLEESHARLPNLQSGALLAEGRGYAAGVRGDWQQSIEEYHLAVANWNRLQRPFDCLRSQAGWITALVHSEKTQAFQTSHRQAVDQIDQLAGELPEREREAFLTSPLVLTIQTASKALD